MKKLIAAAILAALAASPALAQKGAEKPDDPKTVAKKRQADEAERAYNNAIKNTSQAPRPVPLDPWANTRTSDEKK